MQSAKSAARGEVLEKMGSPGEEEGRGKREKYRALYVYIYVIPWYDWIYKARPKRGQSAGSAAGPRVVALGLGNTET